jgi:hypothetical protein
MFSRLARLARLSPFARRPAALDRPHHPNDLRYASADTAGHVESYFLRANHPTERRAIWLKATILAPHRRPTAATADVWCIVFDEQGATPRTWAARATVPLSRATFSGAVGADLDVRLADATFRFGPAGAATGALDHAADGPCRWDLRWQPTPGPLAAPLSIFPYDAMVDGPFPKSKLLTPYPALTFDGTIDVFGATLDVRGWHGMQGHNWGKEHAFEYAWGQCLFPDASGAPHCMVEGFTSRIRLAGRPTPRLSALIVRRGHRRYRFNRVFDFWRQDAEIEDLAWSLRLSGPDGDAHLQMVAEAERMVCLGYKNPDGRMSFCLNSKLARVNLRVNPVNEEAFECASEHGGALEFLVNAPDPRFPDVV